MPESADKWIEEAHALLAEGRTEEVVDRLRRVAETDPDCSEALSHLFWHYTLTCQHEEALHCITRIVRLNPDNTEAKWRRADQLVRLDRLDEAESQYRAVLDDDPECRNASAGLQWIEWLRKRERRTADGEPATRDPATNDRQRTEEDKAAARSRIEDNERRARAHADRGDVRLTSLALKIDLETSTRCNATCITCPKGHAPYYAEDLHTDVFERFARELLPTAHSVNLTGNGEPLLARSFDKIHREVSKYGALVYMVTNATLLSMSRIEKLVRNQTHLVASVDGATRETFELIRIPTRFDRVMNALWLYKKGRDLYAEVGSALGFNFVAMRRNIEELPALVDLAADLGGTFVGVLDSFTFYVPPEIAREHLSFYPDLANRIFDEASERADARGIILDLPAKFGPAAAPPKDVWFPKLRSAGRLFPARRRFPQRCDDPWMKVLIATNGLVHPCCVSRRVMGDLKKDSFAVIWNNRRYRRFRRRIRTFFPPAECRHCNQHWGVNAGNPEAVRAHEGLLVKVLYRLEKYWLRTLDRIHNLLVRPTPPPEPNYDQGRPIRKPRRSPSNVQM